jgi:AcrR family transcriptional regulator
VRRLNQAERVELSDRRMIQTAIRLIVSQGINGMKLTDVGLRCGYSRGLAAMRFGTKAGLLSRVAGHALSRWVARVTAATGAKKGLAAVFAAIDSQSQWVAEEPEEMRALYLIFFNSIDPSAEYHPDVAKTLTAQRRDLARWIVEARDICEIDAKVDPNEEAEQILSGMLGIVYQSLMDHEFPAQRLHEKLKADLRLRLGKTSERRTQRFRSRTVVQP